jgi:ATP-dependent Clp protease adaptor protein ClpS
VKGDNVWRSSATTGAARPVDGPVSLLDKVLGLVSYGYTPRLTGAIARLGSLTSFREAGEVLDELLRVSVSEATVRRVTEAAGRVLVEQERAEAERIRKGLLRPRGSGGRLQQVSVDGAMVPLAGGEWAEVKTVAIGQVHREGGLPRAKELTYFSRVADRDSFREQARVEFVRRATENAREVVAETLKRLLPPYRVILHNDDHNTMGHVVRSLIQCVPSLSPEDAHAIMMEAHEHGHATVITCPKEQAEHYRDRLESCSLTATIEKA